MSHSSLDRLLGETVFPPSGHSLLHPVLTRVRPGAMMHGALLIFDEHQSRLAAEMLPHVSGCEDAVPFAADIFGDFWVVATRGTVRKVQTETLSAYPDEDRESLEDWARAVLDDPDMEDEGSFAMDWQEQHGQLTVSQRLTPTFPFVLRGPHSPELVYAIHLDELYPLRTDFALQTRHLRDGARVLIDLVD